MLNQDHGNCAVFEIEDVPFELLGLAVVQARGRFVEKDCVRVIDDAAGELDQLLLAISKRSGKPGGVARDAEALENGVAFFPSMSLSASARQGVGDQSCECSGNKSDLEILEYGHTVEQANVLVGST